MRIVAQRVSTASVQVNSQTVGAIQQGLLLFIGVGKEDTEEICPKLVNKLINLRIFEDSNGKMNLSATDIGAEILAVSQFTLYADTSHGRRPSFLEAAEPQKARAIIEYFISLLREKGFLVAEGQFGAHMYVSLVNDGPVTIILE